MKLTQRERKVLKVSWIVVKEIAWTGLLLYVAVVIYHEAGPVTSGAFLALALGLRASNFIQRRMMVWQNEIGEKITRGLNK